MDNSLAVGVHCVLLRGDDGQLQEVHVDDLVPCFAATSGKWEAAYGSCGGGWSHLIVKALAKICGSYEALFHGEISASWLAWLLNTTQQQVTDAAVMDALAQPDLCPSIEKAALPRLRRYRPAVMYPEDPIKYQIEFEEDCNLAVVTTGNVPSDLVALFFWGDNTKCMSQVRLSGSGIVSDMVKCPVSASPVIVELHTTLGWGTSSCFNATFRATCEIKVQPINVKEVMLK